MKKSSGIQKIAYLLISISILLVFFALKYAKLSNEVFETNRYVLDTFVTIKIFDTRKNVEKDVKKAFELLSEKENVFDFYSEDSKLEAVNEKLREGSKVRIDDKHLRATIKLALNLARETEGSFDPTIGFLTRAWSFDKGGRLPGRTEIANALKNSGYHKVSFINPDLLNPSGPLMIDLGGIAKGYCLDIAADYLKKKGYRKFLINSVSSTVIFNSLDDEALKVGIEHPRKKGLFAVILAKGGETISTSADNQRFFEFNGKRYHHILDPKSGYPARNFISVTVVARKSAAYTDAISTALFVMGPEKALNFARKNGLKIVALTADGKVILYPRGSWIEIISY
ncbi:MAG: FAD:protein FMN transferase [Actinobacteria bacterium]|nr:FAD:protein FMN transferase [Actinomycetota bacterium]